MPKIHKKEEEMNSLPHLSQEEEKNLQQHGVPPQMMNRLKRRDLAL